MREDGSSVPPPVDPPVGDPGGSEQQAVAQEGRLSDGRKRIGLAALAIMTIHGLARVGGFIQKAVLANFFGTTAAADAATGMQRIFELIYYIPEELLTHSFLPVFTRVHNEEGEPEAWRLASLTGTLHALILVIVSALAILGAPWLVGAVLSGYLDDPEKFATTVYIVRVAMLGLFFTSLGSLTYVILNAYKRFVSPAFGDVAQKAGIVLGLVIVVVGLGIEHPVGYAVGFILGGVFKLITHLVALGPKLRLVRPGFNFRNPALRELGVLMVPLIAATVVSKLRDIGEANIISHITVVGALAAIDYAKKVVWMPVSVLPYALGIALFPFLADWAQQRDKERVTDAFIGASRMMLYIFLPLTVGSVLLGEEVITVLYKRGNFSEGSVALTTGPFIVFAMGMVFYALEIIALQVFYAHRDTKTPFFIGFVSSAIQLVVAWFTALVLDWNAIGVATGMVVAKAVKVVLLWWLIGPRIDSYRWPALATLLIRTAMACLAMGVWIVFARYEAHQVLDLDNTNLALLFVAGTSAVAAAIFFMVSLTLHIDELDMVMRAIKRRLKKGKTS